jgi:CubicO group peptidase (beta-lactamase class C family)
MAADPAKGCACPAGSGGPPAPPGLPPRLDGPAAPLPAPPGGWRDHVLAGEANDGNCWHGLAGVAGHAGLFATADDLLVLADLLLNRGIGGLHAGRLFLSAGTVDLFLSQGLGWSADRPWFKAEAAPAGAVGHTGFTGTSVVLLPRERTAIILLTNRQQAGPDPQGRYPDLSALRSSVVAAVVQGIKQGGRP